MNAPLPQTADSAEPTSKAKDIDRFVAIVNSTRHIFETRYSGSQFHVILWPSENKKLSSKLAKTIQKQDLRVHLITEILPQYEKLRLDYAISPYDAHPNPLAHEMIAEYVNNNILESRTAIPSNQRVTDSSMRHGRFEVFDGNG